jgi:hypothetical protein
MLLYLCRVLETKFEKYSDGMRSCYATRFIPVSVTEFGALGGYATVF